MIFLLVLLIINLKVVLDVVTFKISVFNPIAIFALTVITQMPSQLAIIYTNSMYNKISIPSLLVVMITCQLAFQIGFTYGFFNKNEVKKMHFFDFSFNKIIPLIILFIILGFIPMFFYNNLSTVYGGVNVILNQLRVIGIFGYVISLIFIEKFPDKNKLLLKLFLVLSSIPILYFSLLVKGSREIIFTYVIITLIFLVRIKKNLHRSISLIFFILFIFGAFIGESISEIRDNIKDSKISEIYNIDFVNNIKTSIFESEINNGMDLGNAALLINYVEKHSAYDLGTIIWNDFIYNFIPGRLVGENNKEALYIDLFDNIKTKNYENSLRNNITTITGYGNVFRSFSYIGFIIFYLIGVILSRLSKYSLYSDFYLFVYISCLVCIPNMVTHTTQYMFARLEIIFIFLFPILIFFLRKRSISLTKN